MANQASMARRQRERKRMQKRREKQKLKEERREAKKEAEKVDIPDDPIVIFRTPDGPAVDIARSGLEPGVVGPGDSREFSLRLRAPREPGRYVLQIDMVDELVHWFSDLGWPGVLRDLEVVGSL